MTTPVEQAVAAGRASLGVASAQLAAAHQRFDGAAEALGVLLGASGRVVVTGLGKSGHVGAKLAATFASTGTPAFFVHAADALHGDAGCVAGGDVLFAISKSGTTAEVVAFATMVRERGVPVVALTGCGGGSPLHELADAFVDAAVGCEADPFDLVPTSSTTVALAVGDALAIALMVARGFGPVDFATHHPAGALGQRLVHEVPG